jgi:hypothetical protein
MSFKDKYFVALREEFAKRQIDAGELADSLQDGLMKTHEFVGFLGDTVTNQVEYLVTSMQNGVLKVSELVDEYAGLFEAVDKVNSSTGPVQDESGFTKFVTYNNNTTEDWTASTRDEKIDYILHYFGLKKNENTTEVYKMYTDTQLDDIIKVIRKHNS